MPIAELAPPETPNAEDEESGDFAELLERLGGIPLSRIRLRPPPGTATEADVLAAEAAPRKRLCELIDGVLVEKVMAYDESLLASALIRHLGNHVAPAKLGFVSAPDGMMRLRPGRVRIPDIGFVARERFPDGTRPKGPIPALGPDLAIEILSKSNTKKEMRLKRIDYFAAGARLVWEIDPKTRTVAVYHSAEAAPTVLTEADALTGAPVLPGFTLPLAELFAELD